jgi:beta-glucosidase
MPTATYHFPPGFLWGTATAAHQVEGGNTNNTWHAWETAPEGHILHGDRSGLACDWWGGRWKEDLDRATETRQNAHRFSVEWSRIQPAPDRWDEHALDFYRSMLRGMLARGLTPMVTLLHFTDPLWLAERGGWENDETPALFAAFVRKVVEALKDYASYWITINEPNGHAVGGWLWGGFPPGKKDVNLTFKVYANLVRGHALAYQAIHQLQPQARVGIALNYRGLRPLHAWSPLDRMMVNLLSAAYNTAFPNALVNGKFRFLHHSVRIPEAAGTQDFFGLNYYSVDQVQFRLSPRELFHKRTFPKGAQLSDTGFLANTPTGLYDALLWARRFKMPILITENGVENADDSLRPRYLVEHVHQVWRALNENVPVKGYFYWSLVDNFEWERGWSQRFGLWGLNTETQARIRRPSVDLYAAICRENALSYEMVEKYSPASLPGLFP